MMLGEVNIIVVGLLDVVPEVHVKYVRITANELWKVSLSETVRMAPGVDKRMRFQPWTFFLLVFIGGVRCE